MLLKFQQNPAEGFDIFSKPFELKADQAIYFQLEVKSGIIKSVQEVSEVSPSDELFALRLRDGAKTGRRTVALRTRMYGKVYMRVVLEDGIH